VVRSTGWTGAARWAGVLVCTLLVASIAASSADASVGFGVERYGLTTTEENSSVDTQAGSHPYELTAEAVLEPNAHTSANEVKSLDFELPPGLIINPAAVPQNNAVGTVQVSVAGKIVSATVYNLAPPPGEFARFGFTLEGALVIADISVRTGGDYGMTLSIENLPQREIESVKLTLEEQPSSTFLTLPTSCAGSLQTTLQGESWGGEAASLSASFAQMIGCDRLPFDPSLNVVPRSAQAGEPSGYQVQLSMTQDESPEGLATAQVRNASVTLPAGSSLSLLSMSGSSGCGEAQFALDSSEPARCGNASKVGLVKIGTPLLARPLEGAVFLETPNANPFGALVALYVVAEEPMSGVRIKLAGQIDLNPVTGQPTLTFDDLPQLPIGELSLELFGGERALLVNPSSCGLARSTGHLAPWSASGEAEVSSSFDVSWDGPGGEGGRECPSSLPFEPSLNAGTVSASAGSYSPFILAVSRGDRQQPLSGFQVQLPPGLQWMLGNVPPCGELAAVAGTCLQDSQIGAAIIRVGPANLSTSFTGSIYLTEGYDGARYGLSITLNAMAGPFDLGELVLRATLGVNPTTEALSITSGPLPQLIDGVPLKTRALEMDIDRPEFVLNPTICESRQITATIEGAQGTSVQVSNPFAVQGCQSPPPAEDDSTDTEEEEETAGSTHHRAATSGADSVSLASRRLTTTSHGKAAVKLTCTGTDKCVGELTLTVKMRDRGRKKRPSKTTTIATAVFSIPPGKTTKVELELSSIGRALLSADRGRIGAKLTIRKSSPAPSQTLVENVDFVGQK
jgi:hypothetical protein